MTDTFTYDKLLDSSGDHMFPGLGGMGGRGAMSPKKMKGMLKSMGIDIDELEGVKEVIIRTQDKDIVIENPQVAIMDAKGVRTFQISGDVKEMPLLVIPDTDVELVVAQTGAEAEKAKAALIESNGDIAAAIMKLGAK
jgi:nascent polypeptide-associated complex subunit alpha